MEVPMGKLVRQALSDDKTARVLTAAIVGGLYNSDRIEIQGALPDGRVLTLKRLSAKK